MFRRHLAVVIAVSSVAVVACGGSNEATVSETVVSDAASVTTRPTPTSTTVPATTTMPPTTVPPTTEPAPVTAPDSTIAVPTGECPNGRWRIDPATIGPLDMIGSSDNLEMTPVGSFLATFADGAYSIVSDEFALGVATATSQIDMVVTGSAEGTLTAGADTLTFVESSFDMEAEVTVDGEPAPGDFIVEAFRQTFGSATVPYTCNGDGTLTVTYDTPTGPAAAVHRPA